MNEAAYLAEKIFKLQDRLENVLLDKEERTKIERAIEAYEAQLRSICEARDYVRTIGAFNAIA